MNGRGIRPYDGGDAIEVLVAMILVGAISRAFGDAAAASAMVLYVAHRRVGP